MNRFAKRFVNRVKNRFAKRFINRVKNRFTSQRKVYVPESPRVSQRDREQWYVLVLPARQGVVVRVSSPSATGSSGTSHCVSQRDREQWYMLVLPARQEAVVRVGSPSAAGGGGTC